jgi:hypothetical protein
MADTTRIDKLLLEIEVQRSKLAASKTAIKEFTTSTEKDVSKLNQRFADSANATTRLTSEMQKLSRQRQIADITKDIDKVKRGSQEWFEKLKQIENQLIRVGATRDEISGVAGAISNAQNAQSSGQISPGLARFGAKARFLLPAINVGGVSSEGLSKIVQVLGALPAITAPIILGVGGVVASFVALESILAPIKNALNLAIEANKAYFDAIREGLTTEDVQTNIGNLNDKIAADATELATLQSAFDGAANDAIDTYGILIGGFLTTLGKVSSADDANAARAEELRKSLEQDRATLQRLTDEVDKNSFAAADAAKKEEELAKAREAALPRLQALAEQANDLILRNQEQVGQISEDRRIRDARAEEDWQLQRSAQLEAHLDNLAQIDNAGIERLVAIRVQGNEKIAAANKDIEKINSNIAKVATDLRDDLAKIDRDFMRDEREEYANFREQILKDDKAFAKERARTIEDLNNDLADLESANDVAGFVRRQRDGEIELRRQAEDHNEETQQEQAAFEEERRIAADRRAERIADLFADAEARRADLQQQIAERQLAKEQILKDVQDQLIAERERINATRQATIDAFNEQQKKDEESRNLRLKRQSEDDALQDKRRLDQLNKQLADIALKAQKEAEAIGIVGNSLTQLVSAVQNGVSSAISNIVSQASRASSTSGGVPGFGTNSSYLNPTAQQRATSVLSNFFPPAVNRNSTVDDLRKRLTGNRGRGGIPGFAEGSHKRLITQPTFSMLGEKPGWGDLVTPFPIGGGSPMPNGAGGSTVNVYLQAPIGDGVSLSELHAELQVFGKTINTALGNARFGRRAS